MTFKPINILVEKLIFPINLNNQICSFMNVKYC